MSVAIAGPQGYEYQYLVSIYFCLKYLEEFSIREVYIERMNKEDLFLQLQQGSDTKKVEVQFKNTTRTITMPLLAEWLCHFENKSSDKNLLSRLHKDDSLGLFIVSSGRVNEMVEDLEILAGSDLTKKENEQVTKAALDNLIDSIGNLYRDADKGLKKKQHEFVKEQANEWKANNKNLRQILGRCAFIEKYDEATAKLQMGSLLKKQYGIADSMHKQVILELLERVRLGRDNRSNILDAIKQTLLEFTRIIPQVPEDYVERQIEAEQATR